MKTDLKKETVKTVSTLGKFGSGAAGLALGTLVMRNVPAVGPPMVAKFLPGVVGVALATWLGIKAKSEYAKAAGLGLGVAGFVNILFNAVGKDKLPDIIKNNLALNGVGYVQNYGGYPPSWFNTGKNPVNGFDRGLMGVGGDVVDTNRLLM